MQATSLDRRGITMLSLGHLINDINQGAIPALIPFLVLQNNYSLVDATGMIMASTVLSSIIQPLVGNFSDRHPSPWLIPVGMLMGGIGMSLTGLAGNTYWLLIIFSLISGLGTATFHPECFRYANYVSGQQKGTGTGIFIVGGNLGFAIGPLVLTSLVAFFGLNGTLFMAIPIVIMAFILQREMPRFQQFHPGIQTAGAHPSVPNNLHSDCKAFFRLSLVIVLRSSLYYSLMAFAPIFMVQSRNMTVVEANSALSVLALAGALGTLIYGFLGDRFGRKKMLLLALIPILPALYGFMHTSGPLEIALLGLVGFTLSASFTVAVVMGQEYSAAHVGTASGITTGLAIGVGGMSTPLLGSIAESSGIPAVFNIMLGMLVLAVLVAISLPRLAKFQPAALAEAVTVEE